MAQAAFDIPSRTEIPLLVVFADLSRYAAQSLCVDDAQLAQIMDAHYERVAARIESAGGKLVKFIGDPVLAVFPQESADRGTQALLDLKDEVDRSFESFGWLCRLIIKAHFGPVIAGPYGAAGAKRVDVLGKSVNAAAMLDSTGVALSAEAFRQLEPETRKRFKKHTPTITYIRAEDPHRFRRR